MELSTLRLFLAVAEDGSFSRAAARLHHAQSNLSTKIMQLEQELHAELFIRHSYGVTLTQKGQVLQEYASRLLALADETGAVVAEDGTARGELVIGAEEPLAAGMLPQILSAYHDRYPQVALRLVTGTAEVCMQRLRKRELHGAFVAGPVGGGHGIYERASDGIAEEKGGRYAAGIPAVSPGIVSVGAGRDRLLLVTGRASGVRRLPGLLEQPLLVLPQGCTYRGILRAWLHQKQLIPERFLEFDTLSGLLAGAAAGLGTALLPAAAADAWIRSGLLAEEPLPDSFSGIQMLFLYHGEAFLPCALRSLLHLLEETTTS